jgi:parvulin-like peptidyl-prolyl isomerase
MTASRLILVAALIVAVAAVVVFAMRGSEKPATDNTIVVGVNGIPLTRGEVQKALWAGYAPLALKTLVDRAIVEGVAEKENLKPDPARIDYLLTQEELRAGGPKLLDERLAKEGRTRDDLRQELASQALAEQVMDAQVKVSPEEIKAYYDAHRADFKYGEMVKARLILLDTRASAQAILDVLDRPDADFAGLAGAVSVDPGTKDQDGDMGWIERKDYAPEITEAAFKLKPGQHSGIIEYPDGYAIVRVEARKPAGHQSLEEVSQMIESLLRSDKERDLRFTWPVDQRKKARITIHDPALRKAFEAVRGS